MRVYFPCFAVDTPLEDNREMRNRILRNPLPSSPQGGRQRRLPCKSAVGTVDYASYMWAYPPIGLKEVVSLYNFATCHTPSTSGNSVHSAGIMGA